MAAPAERRVPLLATAAEVFAPTTVREVAEAAGMLGGTSRRSCTAYGRTSAATPRGETT